MKHRKANSFNFIEIQQSKRSFVLTALPAKILTDISYAAVRRKDEEDGAVQRVLNQSRIGAIKSFALEGGDFPASIVLNWVIGTLARDGDTINIPGTIARAAQILDGQHRVAGLKEAIAERKELGEQLVPVAIYEGLSTIDCANIFLSINTEQRPVPRSLVFDLYGIASEELVDSAAVRARDITLSLNEQGKAYEGLIKFPNSPRQRGGIALSTAVTAIKPLVEEKGIFDQIGATSLELQTLILQNYFAVLKRKYGERWDEKDNAFLYAAGFVGAIEFFMLKIVPYCVLQKSFKTKIISNAISLDRTDLIKQDEMKGLGGKDAPRKIYERLVKVFLPDETKVSRFDV